MVVRPSNIGKTFNFKTIGHGKVIHEARKNYETWSSAIQILKFTDDDNRGKIALRFGYCDDTGKLIARPLYLTESQLADLGKKVEKHPEIKKMLKTFCNQIK